MASYTENLNLLKKNPLTDGSDTFNIETMLNENWDKIDAFAGLAANPAELWVWEKFNFTPGSYRDGETHTGEGIAEPKGADEAVTIYYSDSISVDESGTVSLINPSTLNLTYNTYSSASVLKGKYIKYKIRRLDIWQVAFIPAKATFYQYWDVLHEVRVSTLTYIDGVAAVFSHVEYVSSPNSFTYPENGQSGDYWYTRLGQIGEGMTKIETGSYVGTGTCGESNPTSITFDRTPVLFMIDDFGPFLFGFTSIAYVGSKTNTSYPVYFRPYSRNTASWYFPTSDPNSGPKFQMNELGQRYRYIAIS